MPHSRSIMFSPCMQVYRKSLVVLLQSKRLPDTRFSLSLNDVYWESQSQMEKWDRNTRKQGDKRDVKEYFFRGMNDVLTDEDKDRLWEREVDEGQWNEFNDEVKQHFIEERRKHGKKMAPLLYKNRNAIQGFCDCLDEWGAVNAETFNLYKDESWTQDDQVKRAEMSDADDVFRAVGKISKAFKNEEVYTKIYHTQPLEQKHSEAYVLEALRQGYDTKSSKDDEWATAMLHDDMGEEQKSRNEYYNRLYKSKKGMVNSARLFDEDMCVPDWTEWRSHFRTGSPWQREQYAEAMREAQRRQPQIEWFTPLDWVNHCEDQDARKNMNEWLDNQEQKIINQYIHIDDWTPEEEEDIKQLKEGIIETLDKHKDYLLDKRPPVSDEREPWINSFDLYMDKWGNDSKLDPGEKYFDHRFSHKTKEIDVNLY